MPKTTVKKSGKKLGESKVEAKAKSKSTTTSKASAGKTRGEKDKYQRTARLTRSRVASFSQDDSSPQAKTPQRKRKRLAANASDKNAMNETHNTQKSRPHVDGSPSNRKKQELHAQVKRPRKQTMLAEPLVSTADHGEGEIADGHEVSGDAEPTVETAGSGVQLTVAQQQTVKAEGFALLPVEKGAADEWAALSRLLETDGSFLGRGRDVGRSNASYDSLRLACAWRLYHAEGWRKYQSGVATVEAQMDRLTSKDKIMRFNLEVKTRPAAAGLPLKLSELANEQVLLHGTQPDTVLSLLSMGLNERFSGTNAGNLFGDGIYLAEDAGKTDQYVMVDAKHKHNNELHKLLYESKKCHPGSVYYVLVVRAALGQPIRTKTGGREAKSLDTSQKVFPKSTRELAPIPDMHPPLFHHSLVAEKGESVVRYREFVVFHGEYLYPEYILAYQRLHGDEIVETTKKQDPLHTFKTPPSLVPSTLQTAAPSNLSPLQSSINKTVAAAVLLPCASSAPVPPSATNVTAPLTSPTSVRSTAPQPTPAPPTPGSRVYQSMSLRTSRAPSPPLKMPVLPKTSHVSIDIDVPSVSKDQVKALGAKFDDIRCAWYVPAFLPLEPFKEWIGYHSCRIAERYAGPTTSSGVAPSNMNAVAVASTSVCQQAALAHPALGSGSASAASSTAGSLATSATDGLGSFQLPAFAEEDLDLDCPFDDKDEVKALGAKFDWDRKVWYVPEGLALEPFKKWLISFGSVAAPASPHAFRSFDLPVASSQPIYLTSSYNEKDKVKALGARFDGKRKSWYVPPGKALVAFTKWIRSKDLEIAKASPFQELAAHATTTPTTSCVVSSATPLDPVTSGARPTSVGPAAAQSALVISADAGSAAPTASIELNVATPAMHEQKNTIGTLRLNATSQPDNGAAADLIALTLAGSRAADTVATSNGTECTLAVQHPEDSPREPTTTETMQLAKPSVVTRKEIPEDVQGDLVLDGVQLALATSSAQCEALTSLANGQPSPPSSELPEVLRARIEANRREALRRRQSLSRMPTLSVPGSLTTAPPLASPSIAAQLIPSSDKGWGRVEEHVLLESPACTAAWQSPACSVATSSGLDCKRAVQEPEHTECETVSLEVTVKPANANGDPVEGQAVPVPDGDKSVEMPHIYSEALTSVSSASFSTELLAKTEALPRTVVPGGISRLNLAESSRIGQPCLPSMVSPSQLPEAQRAFIETSQYEALGRGQFSTPVVKPSAPGSRATLSPLAAPSVAAQLVEGLENNGIKEEEGEDSDDEILFAAAIAFEQQRFCGRGA